MSYRVYFSDVDYNKIPLVTIIPKSAWDARDIVCSLQIGEFCIPLEVRMYFQLLESINDFETKRSQEISDEPA